MLHERTKLFKLDMHSIREKVSAKKLLAQHISSTYQLIDILTEALSIHQFHFLHNKLSVMCMPLNLKGAIES